MAECAEKVKQPLPTPESFRIATENCEYHLLSEDATFGMLIPPGRWSAEAYRQLTDGEILNGC